MGNLMCCVQVDQSTVAIKEHFGKFEEVLQPGCHCVPWVFGQRVAGHLSVRLQQLDVRCKTKTKDNVYVIVVGCILYKPVDEKESEAFYKLTDATTQIRAYAFDAIRAIVPKLLLDEAFEQRNDIAKAIKDQLEEISSYGFEIVHTLIVDIEPGDHIKQVMNEMNAATRMRLAAKEKAADEEAAKYQWGVGFASQCQAIMQVMGHRANLKDVMDSVLIMQYLNTMKEVTASSKSPTVFIPHGPGMVRDIATLINEGFLQGDTVKVVGHGGVCDITKQDDGRLKGKVTTEVPESSNSSAAIRPFAINH